MMCLNNDEPKLSHAQKSQIERIVRQKLGEHMANMSVDRISIVDGSAELQALAVAYAAEVRDTAANTMKIEAKHLI